LAERTFFNFFAGSRVARFFLLQFTKTRENVPNYVGQNIPNGRKIDQMAVK
jgi:hypothetical protein